MTDSLRTNQSGRRAAMARDGRLEKANAPTQPMPVLPTVKPLKKNPADAPYAATEAALPRGADPYVVVANALKLRPKGEPIYRVRHHPQPRNRHLVDAVDLFFATKDTEALKRFYQKLTIVQQILVCVYLIANDFASTARGLGELRISNLALLDRENGREVALALGWV